MNPEVSVIIASYNARRFIGDCLRSLERQVTPRRFEVILVDSSIDGTAELVDSGFPFVRIRRFSQRKYCGGARNVGIAMAKGPIVAFIDADCVADQHWIENVVKAHQAPCPAIGGAIANANPESYVGWAAYFTEFSHWMPRTRSAWMDDIAGANMSYKKELFDQYGRFIEGTYGSDTDFHWRIGQQGHRLRFEPSILVSHHNIDNVKRFLTHEFHHGRSFGRVHISGKGLSRWSRMVKVAGAPLGPVRMLATIAFNNLRNRIYFRQFVAALPLLILGIICWSAGQVVSYATG